jgi:hypothetical protein
MYLKATQIKIAPLLLAYSIVLFHSILPHCNGEHPAHCSKPLVLSSLILENTVNCANEHNHCHLQHDDGLHVGYLKPYSYCSNENNFFISLEYTQAIFQFVILCQAQIAWYIDDIIPIRCCAYAAAKFLRGPPSENI